MSYIAGNSYIYNFVLQSLYILTWLDYKQKKQQNHLGGDVQLVAELAGVGDADAQGPAQAHGHLPRRPVRQRGARHVGVGRARQEGPGGCGILYYIIWLYYLILC